jgi:hypothetical protein
MDDHAQKTKGQSVSPLAEELERARYRERSLEAALVRSLEEIKSLRSSRLWRITRRLRFFSRVMRRVKRLMKFQLFRT